MFEFFEIINLNIIYINVNNELYNFIDKKEIIEFDVFKAFKLEKFA